MQIEMTMRYHLSLARMASPKRTHITSVSRHVGKGPSYSADTFVENVNWCSHCGKLWKFLKKLKMELPYALAVPLPGTYPNKKKH